MIVLAPRDGLLGASRLALRVALRAIAIAAARRCRRTVLLSVGGSNWRRAHSLARLARLEIL